MNISWLGTASILIETKETTILFDPYVRKNSKLGMFPLEILDDVDAIFITHPHFDHFSSIPDSIHCHHIPIFVCNKGVEIINKMNLNCETIQEIQKDTSITYKNIKIRAYQGGHCTFDKGIVYATIQKVLQPRNSIAALKIGKLHKQYHIDVVNDVFAFEVSVEGKKIFIMGSANLQCNIRYPQNMDLLVYPYQGRSDMLEYSIPLIERLKPKAIMLDHFDDAFPPISCTMNCQEFISFMKVTYPDIKVVQPIEYEKYEV